MPKPILTLTTDFGTSDHFVGAMKGVILGICPQAQIVDISHEAGPFAVEEGAFLIAQAYRFFPKKTVHVVVVDPGVGSTRRPIVVEAAGQFFVAPDNGVLALIYAREKHRVRVMTNERYFLKPISRTFHGRDIFAPAAAHLAAGLSVARLGKAIDDYIQPNFARPEPSGARSWKGRVLKIDRFGNLITNFCAADFPGLAGKRFALAVGSCRVTVLAQNYAERDRGELFVIAGSSGYLEVSTNQGSAAHLTGYEMGTPIELTLGTDTR